MMRNSRPAMISHSFNYNVSMLEFSSRTWIDLPALKTDINEFDLPSQLLQNAKNMGITRLTSCQSAFMTHFFQGNRNIDYIIDTPHLSGLTSGVAICMVKYVMDYYEYDHTRPKALSPMIIVMCEKDDAVNRSYNIFSKVANGSGINVYNLRENTMRTNVERCGSCDILVATPFVIKKLDDEHKINLARVRFIFVDWADKVYNAFQLPSTTHLVEYLGKRNNAVRILGCEHLYESRRVYFGESCRGSPLEIRVSQPREY